MGSRWSHGEWVESWGVEPWGVEPATAARATATRVLWLWAYGCTTHAHHVLRRHADQRPGQRCADVDVAAVAAAHAPVGERLHEHLVSRMYVECK